MCRSWTLVVVLLWLVGCNATPPQAQPPEENREAAYRANNRGAALLEQYLYDGAVDAFEEALRLEPSLKVAQINLPIALFYAGRLREALEAANAALAQYPDAPQPRYIAGLIHRAQNMPEAAIEAFGAVLAIDPDDVGAKVNLALMYLQQGKFSESAALCESALSVEPYNATAAYTYGLALTRAGDRDAAARAFARFQELRTAGYAVTYSQTYLEQGRYAEAIASTGAELDLVNTAPPEVAFADATASVLEPTASNAGQQVTAGGVALADIDKDGDLDVIAAGPSGVRLLRNDRPRLVDVTREAGLPQGSGTATGVAAGDFNNDTKTDLLFLFPTGSRLFSQAEGGKFIEVSLGARSSGEQVSRAAAFSDVDHDGDLDILVGARLLRNNGNNTFQDATAAAGLDRRAAIVAVAPTDYDNRRDVDLLMVVGGARPKLYRNLRTGPFVDVAEAAGLPPAAPYTSLSVGDVNKDGYTDAFFGHASAAGTWAISDGRGRFRVESAAPSSQGTAAALIFDYDNDGLLDLFAVTDQGPRVLRNVGNGWQDQTMRAVPASLNQAIGAGGGVAAIAAGDVDLDGDTDVVAMLKNGSISIWRNDGGNRNRSLRVDLAGRVSNRDGIGAKVEARAGSLHQKIETAAATPASVPADLLFGLGNRHEADVVRVTWPAGIVQAETPPAAATGASAALTVRELDRKPSSCPYLYTWNGSRFEFVTDFLGGGEMGYWVAPGVRGVPDPVEYVRITDEQLKSRDGRFEIRVTNELEEVLFLDHLRLLAVTHPADASVFPDEGMRATVRPFGLSVTRNARPPRAATDDHGHDVLPQISLNDRRFAEDFAVLPIRGYARDHALTLDVGDPPPGSARRVLLLTGWTDYAFSSDNVAAHQAGLALRPPVLQAKAGGIWRTVDADVGVPVGRPQTLVVDITKFRSTEFRLVTNMRIYWDQILVADAAAAPVTTETVPRTSARLAWRGFSLETSPDGRPPFVYDYGRVLLSSPWKLMPGRYTREGDVAELLEGEDDRFVVARSGDELSLSFDASALGPLPPKTRRTFLLYSAGYSKEMDLNSASPDRAGPLPFRAMRGYPYSAPDRYPHESDVDRFHTRVVSRAIPPVHTAPDGRVR